MKFDYKVTNWLFPWLCWSIGAAIYFFQYGLLIFPSVLTKELQESLSINVFEVGVFSSVFLYSYVCMQIPVGLMFDKFDSRVLLCISILILVISCVIVGLANDYFIATTGRVIMGIGGSFAFVGTIYLSRSWFSSAIFPIAVGLTEALSGIGDVSFSAIFVYLKHVQPWQWVVLEVGIALLFLGVLVLIFVRDRPSIIKIKQISVVDDFKLCLKNKVIWLLGLYTGLSFSHFGTMGLMWNIPYFAARYHESTLDAVLENTSLIIGFILGCTFIGYVSRFFREEKIILISVILLLLVNVGSIYLSLRMYLEGFDLFLSGILSSSSILSFPLARRLVSEQSYGVISGFLNMFFGGITILVMPIVSLILKITSMNFYLAYLPVLVSTVIAVFIAFILYIKRKDYFHDFYALQGDGISH